MAGFSESIKNFKKIRDYMRDFYVYGFKSRKDFKTKSLRTYDNEKRRIESYLGEYMKWEYGSGGKKTVISLDSSKISQNPLYVAWKSKSFTANDIMLHFYILDILSNGKKLSVVDLTNEVCYRSEKIFDPQTIRLKCVEYAKAGILIKQKQGRTVLFKLSSFYLEELTKKIPLLIDAIHFFSESAPLGEVGSFLLDNEIEKHDFFSFKHHYIVHTLEDGILFDILFAIRNNLAISFENVSEKTKNTITFEVVPLKIFVSSSTGRRYVCVYTPHRNRFASFRLDYIKSVKLLKVYSDSKTLKEKLNLNINKVWGVGFGGRARLEVLTMKLHINEKEEQYIIDRINREGRGGNLVKLESNIFIYTKECYDVNEMSPWIKTFTGRILELKSTNKKLVTRFYRDMDYMNKMYEEGD